MAGGGEDTGLILVPLWPFCVSVVTLPSHRFLLFISSPLVTVQQARLLFYLFSKASETCLKY